MYRFPVVLFYVLLFWGCKGSPGVDDADVVAMAGDKVLRRMEIVSMVPKNASSADSLLYTEAYIKKWIKDVLVHDVALDNLSNEERGEIDNLTDEYRRSLVRYRYQDRLIREKLSANIRESDKLNYYEEHQSRFVLDKSLIKGLFLKIPADAPGLKDVKAWYKQTSEDALEKIEKYSLQNALIYAYFYDRWMDFDEIMDVIPMYVSNPNDFLKKNKHIELTDSMFCYLLNINEYLTSGTVAPYDYSSAQVTEMLVNQRKMEFLRNFEEELYNEALKNGNIYMKNN